MIINSTFFDAIARHQHNPFIWGSNDCALFVANIYLELFGTDLAADVRGTYDTEYDGMRKIIKMGGWDGILSKRNFTKIDTNFVSRGDVVIAENAMGIWVGTYAIFAGNIVRPLTAVTAVYRYKE